ncbi:sorbosone dehydrogenase family protein [Phyllobacterium sp. BT25]|uniref:Sorbosone dehydrogenase family protein n=1 Tax=Phyllobacterium pellucidum TaxID=2740464 RepID=A0A849W105_9HYPH|nr:sorbosone dehydrogenase family protein [Phyllobacterium pellucidum]NTS33693.1 sorbosone dehydrogenase family protein [Phyllobacterium pellucidum]
MAESSPFARFIAFVSRGIAAIRHSGDGERAPVYGTAPAIPEAKPQGRIPTLKMPTAKGWEGEHKPTAAAGLKVNAFARGLVHPRNIYVLPNGDVLVAESMGETGNPRTFFDHAMLATMQRARASGDSPNRVTLLRDADGDGVAEESHAYIENVRQPFGIALVGETLYVGASDALLAYPYEAGATRISKPSRKLMDLVPGGHWTRNLIASKDGTKLYVAVGSLSNIADAGMAAEENRACIHEYDLTSGRSRIFAGGLRNPVGMAWEPEKGMLWTVVNERDGLGDETPPDYLTSVSDGGFYGWPYCYWNRVVDDRVPQDPAKVALALQPDYALGGHTASLGLCWLPESTLPGFPPGMAIGQHGSWNRSKLSGYKLAFVAFEKGKPVGMPRDILTDFLSPDEKYSYGRPVGVALAADGAVLMADDVGDVIWRVKGAE